ncbi:MAG: oligosaccharide flippase family protein, partial [Bacteroidota bacterium]
MLKKSLVYIIGKGISAVLAIVFIPLYTKFLAPQEYGISTILLITIGFGSTIFTFGLNTGFMVMYYKFDKETSRKIFTLIHLLFLILLPISLIICPFYTTGKLFFGSDFTLTRFWLISLTILFYLYYNFYTAFLRVQQKPLLYVIFNISYTLVVGLLTLWFIVYMNLSYWSFLYSTFIGNFMFAIAGSVYYRGFFKKFSFREQADNIRRLFRICWPILPTQFANYLLNSGDKYILKLKRSSDEVGIYSISYKFGSLFESFLIGPFFESYNPVAYDTFANDI